MYSIVWPFLHVAVAYKGVHTNPPPPGVVDSMKEDEGKPNVIFIHLMTIPWIRTKSHGRDSNLPDLLGSLMIWCLASRSPDFYQILPIYHEILNRKKLLILSIFLQGFHITLSYPITSHTVSPLKNIAVSKCRKSHLREFKVAKFPGGA